MNSERILSVNLLILALIIGWFLNSLSPIFQGRRDNKKAWGKAIADLLEIRHRLISEKAIMREMKKLLPLTPGDERTLCSFVRQMLPPLTDLSKRFDETVTLVCGFDPVLGFHLRSKDFVTQTGALVAGVEAQAGAIIPAFTEIENQISQLMSSELVSPRRASRPR